MPIINKVTELIKYGEEFYIMKKYNQALIKDKNKKQVYHMIEDIPGISRAQIADAMKVSKTTVSALVDELMQEGFVLDEGVSESGRQGRKPNSLVVNSEKNKIVVLDWRKEVLAISLVDAGIEVELTQDYYLKQEEKLEKLRESFHDFMENSCREINVMGICLIIPGMIDEKADEIISVVLQEEGEERYKISQLRNIFVGYPLAVLNDIACYAYAENVFGQLEGDSCIYININDGVGAAIIHNGNLLGGASGMASQFGHFSVDRKGLPCSCGNRGCLENQIGELALPRQFKQFGITYKKAQEEKLLFKDLAYLVEQGNCNAARLMESMAEDFSYALCNAVALFHPEEIVIGGIGRKLGDSFLEDLKRYMKKMGFRQFMSDVKVAYTELKEESVIQGAAKYYIDNYFRFNDTDPEQYFCG